MLDKTKPVYRVPTMDDIRALSWNGFTVASTFAGCGGSSTGYRMAGFKILWASEFVPAARASYTANMDASTVLDERDIRKVEASDILSATGLRAGDLDVLDGSPPCQAFSTAGKLEKGWGKERTYEHGARQRNEDLFFEFIRLVRGIRPKVFVAENVSGLVKGVAKGYFLDILVALKGCGYRVEARLLDAQWLGVPQRRQRLIFVGVRDDLNLAPEFPKPLGYRYSVRDALPWLARAMHDTRGQPQYSVGEIIDRPAPTIVMHGAHHFKVEQARVVHDTGGAVRDLDITDRPSPTITVGHANFTHYQVLEPETDISRFEIGKEWDKLKPGEVSDRYFSLQKSPIDGPCPTVTGLGGTSSRASVTHPIERRKFTIAELRRICGFPDDFILAGTYAQQWERLGNAVPPIMMRHVAEVIRDRILLRIERPAVRKDGSEAVAAE